MMTDANLTSERLAQLLEYKADTGEFVWRESYSPHARKGKVAGGLTSRGYRQIRLDNRLYMAHRLAWLHNYGVWPDGQLDHVNGNRADNRLENLREATAVENQQNRKLSDANTSGLLGASWNKHSKKWAAQIRTDGRIKYLGKFPTAEEAHNAYLAAKLAHHTFNPVPREPKRGDE